ncbi:hypothetical protein TFLX_06560 [Thermoflexales bacterium]|nr:hypothetical protein TFLX_06560 [Thermoflexales bacterium]
MRSTVPSDVVQASICQKGWFWMGKKLYRQETSGEIHTLNPHRHYVTLPTSTIDLWMPLIGAVGVGVYAMYCRLAREGRVRGSDLKGMAKAARISDNTLRSLNQTLERIGFIRVEKPEGARRLRHHTTEIVLLEPPTRVSVELIRELECRSGYEVLTHWLVESGEAENTPPQTPESPSVDEGAPSSAPQSATQSVSSSPVQREQAPMNAPPRALERPKPPWESPARAVQQPQTPMSASLRAVEGPVALSSVVESVWQRQCTLQSPSGVAPERVVEAPQSATLESLRLNLLGSENSPPPPIHRKPIPIPPWKGEAPTSAALESLGEMEESAHPLKNPKASSIPPFPWPERLNLPPQETEAHPVERLLRRAGER